MQAKYTTLKVYFITLKVIFVLRSFCEKCCICNKKVINIINTINITTSKLLTKLLTLNYPQKQTKTSLHYKVINIAEYRHRIT